MSTAKSKKHEDGHFMKCDGCGVERQRFLKVYDYGSGYGARRWVDGVTGKMWNGRLCPECVTQRKSALPKKPRY